MPDPPPADFDEYAGQYAELLEDPIRARFAPGGSFFVQRKLILLLSQLRRLGFDAKSMSWLDVGCGQGELLRLGRDEFSETAGTDPSSLMLASCLDLSVRLQRASARIPYGDGRFDVVSLVCVYHHVVATDRPGLTSEAVRVLKPGGVLVVIEHNPFNPLTRLIVSRTPIDEDARLLSACKVRRLLRKAGMRSLMTRYFLYLPERQYARFARFEDYLSRIPLGGQYAVFGRKI